MLSPLLNIVFHTYGPVLSGIVAGLLYRAYFNRQVKSKIKGYQDDILRSNIKVFELEAINERLEKRLKEMEVCFSKDHIIMN